METKQYLTPADKVYRRRLQRQSEVDGKAREAIILSQHVHIGYLGIPFTQDKKLGAHSLELAFSLSSHVVNLPKVS